MPTSHSPQWFPVFNIKRNIKRILPSLLLCHPADLPIQYVRSPIDGSSPTEGLTKFSTTTMQRDNQRKRPIDSKPRYMPLNSFKCLFLANTRSRRERYGVLNCVS